MFCANVDVVIPELGFTKEKVAEYFKELLERVKEIRASEKLFYQQVKDIYKKTYQLDDYTGYLPYVYLVDNNKLINKNANVKTIDDLKEMISK